MKNLFKGVQVTFNDIMFDNSKHNAALVELGAPKHLLLPEKESSIASFERTVEEYIDGYGLKFEREHTKRGDGSVTMYISFSERNPTMLRQTLAALLFNKHLTNVTYGSMKVDATFRATK